nr:hypothetical protein [Candidatus Sigynarchaeota archaeon]
MSIEDRHDVLGKNGEFPAKDLLKIKGDVEKKDSLVEEIKKMQRKSSCKITPGTICCIGIVIAFIWLIVISSLHVNGSFNSWHQPYLYLIPWGCGVILVLFAIAATVGYRHQRATEQPYYVVK